MEDTTDARSSASAAAGGASAASGSAALSAGLAGLQAGMLGTLWMLAWVSVSSEWQNRGFWSPENLFATAFYGNDAVRSDFSSKTIPGLALYLLVYSLLGGLFALLLRARESTGRLALAGIAFACGWYYLAFHAIWKSLLPMVYLLTPNGPMLIGHLIYGFCVGRYPAHYPGQPPAAEPSQSTAAEPVQSTTEPVRAPTEQWSLEPPAAPPEPLEATEAAPVHEPPVAPEG